MDHDGMGEPVTIIFNQNPGKTVTAIKRVVLVDAQEVAVEEGWMLIRVQTERVSNGLCEYVHHSVAYFGKLKDAE